MEKMTEMQKKMAKLRAMKNNGNGMKKSSCPKGMHMMGDGKCMKDSDMMKMKVGDCPASMKKMMMKEMKKMMK